MRGELSSTITPPIRKPTPGMPAPIDSIRPDTRAWYSGGVDSCSAVITATHWMPLPAPPITDIRHANSSVFALAMPR